MQLVEARQGRPLPEILADLYYEHRNLSLVAASLHMTRQNLWLWMKHLGITGRYLRALATERDMQARAQDKHQ